jgi:RNA polymerase sigma factor (sigma-70 family)
MGSAYARRSNGQSLGGFTGEKLSERDIELVRAVVARVLRRFLGAHDSDYEDAFQNSLQRVLETLARDTFKRDCGLAAWAAMLARNVAADSLRDRYRERRLFVPDDPPEIAAFACSSEPDPERVALARERLRDYGTALSRLRPHTAWVVYLHDVLGYDLSVIARATGISTAAAQSRLVRGRTAIGGGPR